VTDSSTGEDLLVGRAIERLAGGPTWIVGPGHDCGVLRAEEGAVVTTTDALVDGVHFRLADCGPEAAARKSLLVNLSDLAAAAAEPLGFVVCVVLPFDAPDDLFDRLVAGLAETARAWNCWCGGGDTNRGPGPLTLAVTAFGRPPAGGIVTRSGARPGDRFSVTGPLGGSLLGRHLDFTPRVREARVLHALRVPHAMMDLSDGLSTDLPRLCRMSGVGARIEAGAVPIHPDAAVGAPTGRSPLERALDDGEDFELLVAHAPLEDATRVALAREGVALHEIGRATEPREGLRLARGGIAMPLVARGYDHFRGG
jgi:thiamine-monophosphate kinase